MNPNIDYFKEIASKRNLKAIIKEYINMPGTLIWITGLSGSGKTTIGKLVYQELKKIKPESILIDGDTFRSLFSIDLNHNENDRFENALRIAKLCVFLTNQGINVVCSTMSLYKDIHQFNREQNTNYIEVFLDVDKEELYKRDPKELYKKALNGEISDVVGINLPYDFPENCNICLKNNNSEDLERNVHKILNLVVEKFDYPSYSC